MLFITANSITPTSAKTASHIPEIPKAPRIQKLPFIPNEKIIFSRTILLVRLAI